MNKYALYNEDTKISFGPFICVCRGHYKSTKNLNLDSLDLGFGSKISVIDLNGAVLLTGCTAFSIKNLKDTNKVKTYVNIYGGES